MDRSYEVLYEVRAAELSIYHAPNFEGNSLKKCNELMQRQIVTYYPF